MKLSRNGVQGAALATFVALISFSEAHAQVSQGGSPASLRAPLTSTASLVAVEAPDVTAYLLEDEATGYRPLRYGALLDLDLSVDDGTWSNLADGTRVWQLRVASEGAHSLALEFDLLWLPEGAQMFVLGAGEQTLGAYTSDNHHLDGTFVFEPLPGSELTVEIYVPAGVEDPVVDTRSLIYDYRNIFGLMDGSVSVGGSPAEGNCLVDVNCPEGDDWELQKRATVRTLSAGALCSGALVNNTAVDGTRYVLTADHCGQTSNAVFRFGYERPGCSSGAAPTGMSVSGCTVLSTNSTYDNRLLRINTTIPDNYEPYFAGWSRGLGPGSMAFAMGHPSGGPKKISIDGNGMTRTDQFWQVSWSEGMLEGGSSGGPIFDQNGRVRGPACCVSNFVCGSQAAFFGRLDQFFNANNIAQWLDPLGTGQTLLDGFDPICGSELSNYCVASPHSTSGGGTGAVINMFGSLVVSANNFTLEVNGAPPEKFGLFYYGPTQISTNFGDGVRCVGGSTIRLPLVQTDVFGYSFSDLDLTAHPSITGGATQNFQFWFRDPMGPGGTGFNTSDGLEVTFCE